MKLYNLSATIGGTEQLIIAWWRELRTEPFYEAIVFIGCLRLFKRTVRCKKFGKVKVIVLCDLSSWNRNRRGVVRLRRGVMGLIQIIVIERIKRSVREGT